MDSTWKVVVDSGIRSLIESKLVSRLNEELLDYLEVSKNKPTPLLGKQYVNLTPSARAFVKAIAMYQLGEVKGRHYAEQLAQQSTRPVLQAQ